MLIAAPGAGAAVTIGSDLTGANNLGFGCLGQPRCTAAQTSPDDGYVSPVTGVITAWRVKISTGGGDLLNLRVLRPGSTPGSFSGAGTSATETTTSTGGGAILGYSAHLPIEAGDRIGVDAFQDVLNMATADADKTISNWAPVLADGGAPRPADSSYLAELLLNADVVPDNHVALLGVRRKKAFRYRALISLPNPGELAVIDAGATASAAASARKRLLNPVTVTAGPGTTGITLRLTKAARARLTRKGVLRPRIRLSFTPKFGETASTLANPRLKLKRRR